MAPRYSAAAEARRVASALEAHDRLDMARFDALGQKLDAIHAAVVVTSEATKSLLASRTYVRGAWRAIVILAGTVATVVSIAVAWFRH